MWWRSPSRLAEEVAACLTAAVSDCLTAVAAAAVAVYSAVDFSITADATQAATVVAVARLGLSVVVTIHAAELVAVVCSTVAY